MGRRRERRRRDIEKAAEKLLRRALQSVAAERNASRPTPPESSQLVALREVERYDGFATFRNGIRKAADLHDEWAGIPMPMNDARLIIEPRFPRAAELSGPEPEPWNSDGATIVNQWWSTRLRSDCVLYREHDGQLRHLTIPRWHGLRQAILSIGLSDAWGVEQEHRALSLLGDLLPHHRFKQYLLTGSFIERSVRSGVFYLFRKLRPTVAMVDDGKGDTRFLVALCLHPIAYYEGSWAGAMCPTDDVIAHLMLMRGDEAMFWRRSNQHSVDRPEAGL